MNPKEQAQNLLPPGATLYPVLMDVSKSGMSARFRLFTVSEGRILDVTSLLVAAKAANGARKGRCAAVVHGCGMNRMAHLVMEVSFRLHGFAEALKCGEV